MNTLQEMIDVMTAARDGKKTLRRQRGKTLDWEDNEDFYFNWVDYDYRVKTEPPKPREYYLDINSDGSHGGLWEIRDSEKQVHYLCKGTRTVIKLIEVL